MHKGEASYLSLADFMVVAIPDFEGLPSMKVKKLKKIDKHNEAGPEGLASLVAANGPF